MAKSKCIRQFKNKIMSELSQDSEIVNALGFSVG